MESVRPVRLAGRVHVKKQWRAGNAWEQTGGPAAMLWGSCFSRYPWVMLVRPAWSGVTEVDAAC